MTYCGASNCTHGRVRLLLARRLQLLVAPREVMSRSANGGKRYTRQAMLPTTGHHGMNALKLKEVELSRGAQTALAVLALRRRTTVAEIAEELVWAELDRLGLKIGGNEAPRDDAPDTDRVETPAQIHARKIIGWTKAAGDAEPVLDYVAAQYRIITAADFEKSAWDIVYELFEAVRAEIDKEFERSKEGQG